VADQDGRPRHRRGVTDVPGLYLLGLTWQHTRGSALLGWVRDDAEFLAERIDAFENAGIASPGEARETDDVGAPQQARVAQEA